MCLIGCAAYFLIALSLGFDDNYRIDFFYLCLSEDMGFIFKIFIMSDSAQPNRLDTLLKVATPEAVDIYLRPASVLSRCRAYAVDLLIRFVIFWVITWLAWQTRNETVFVVMMLLNGFFCVWLYYVFFEMFWGGRTLGKRIFGLRTINDDGTHLTWSSSLLRNLMRLIDGMPFFYALGATVSLCHPYGKRLGDILAATVVVYDDQSRAKAGGSLNLQGVEAVAPSVVLTREEQQAILSFAERRHLLTRARAEELADMLAEAIFGTPQADAEHLIIGLAKYYAGEERKAAA